MQDLDLPDHWTENARTTYEEVITESPNLSGADLSALWHAAELETSADALDAVARAAGYVATGSQGQPVTHPAVTEARLARTAASAILARIAPTHGSPSERARRAARARWSHR